jgi:ABC-2 type transport system ATP-binding protein
MVTSMTNAIEAHGLVKTFGRTRALDGLDLTVTEGEVHGFLGPNGAGKSTTIRVLLGLLRANGGSATVLGRDPWRDSVAIHRDIAYVPGDVALWPNLSGGEIIDLLTSLRGGADRGLRARLLDAFELDPKKKGRSYSKGNRQKVALVAAFARPAALYILDEPTSGLDPVMESVFQAEVERVVRDGATVLLSSHILSEVERLCDRVTIVRTGRAVESGTLAELRHLTRTNVRVTTAADAASVGALPGVYDLRQEAGQLAFDVDTDRIGDVLGTLTRAGVSALTATPPSLEELFLRHYGDRIEAAADAADAADGELVAR